MKKLMLALSGALALVFAVHAEDWFKGGIEEGWPTKATGGEWSNTNGTTYADNTLTVSASTDKPLTFKAIDAKAPADYTAKISSTVGFTAFDALPQVPADAKAGVIAYNGTYWALALDGTTNNWADTGISVANGAVKIDVTFLETNTVEYVIGASAVTNTVKAVTSVQNVCTSGDGTLAHLSATAEAKAKPVVPGTDVPVPSAKTQEQFITDINSNPTEKAKYLKAPEGAETTETYLSLFSAAPNGSDKVTFVLNDTGTNAVLEATEEAATNVLAVALSAEGNVFTVTEPIKGFYYSFKQGGDVTNLTFKAESDKNQLATEANNPSFELVKPDDKGFYNTLVTPAPYEEK